MEALYHAALELSGDERMALLAKSDPEVRRAVEALLAQGGSGAAVLDRPAWEQASGLSEPTRTQFAPGEQLGWYRVEAKIGAGGMGEVYRAKDTKLEREVAIKVLPASVAQDPERRARFEREAKVLAALNHPNIAHIYGVEECAFVMELVEGETLRGPLPIDTAIDYAKQIADALEAAHDKGIIHRDLKPANIMITPQGVVKLLDFGLAAVAQPSGKSSGAANSPTLTEPATHPGMIMGTAAYMSPEQAAGKPVDKRADIWSFGVVFWEMLTGHRLFDGETPSHTMAAVLQGAIDFSKLPQTTPPTIRDLMKHCLDRDLQTRLRDIGEARFQLQRYLSNPADRIEIPQPVPEESVPAAAQRAPARQYSVAAAAVLLVALAAYGIWYWRGPARTSQIKSIAILPLDNYSGDPSQDYFAEGMTDELTTDLATISQLRVISRGSVMQFKGEHRPPTPEIAKALNVDAVVEGSVLRAGDKVRITAQLIDARVDKHLWAKSFERNSRDVLALQDELAMAIASEIHVQLTPTEQSRLTTAPTVDPEAHDAYLKGRYFFNRPSDENLKKAIAQFEEAVRLNPQFALAFSGLSDAYLWAGYNEGVLTAAEARPKAKAAAERAIQLDDTSAEAHASLATFKLFYEYDWAGCESEFRRAFALNPNYAFAHDQFGLALAFQGRLEESLSEGKLASELDPLSPQIPIDNIFAYAWQGKYQGAREQTKRAADLDPAYFFPQMAYGWIDIEAGKIRDAIPELQKAKAMDSPPFVTAFLGYAYGTSGDRAHAMAEMEDLKKRSLHGRVLPFNLALVYIGLGDRERALDSLERAYASDSQWMGWLRGDRIFDPLRSEPRFVALMRKLRFEN